MAGDRRTMRGGDGVPGGSPGVEPLAGGVARLLRSNRRPLIVAVCLWAVSYTHLDALMEKYNIK